MTIVLVGAFLLPNSAFAKKHQEGSYKPKSAIEKAERKKYRKNKKVRNKKKNTKAVTRKAKAKKAPAKRKKAVSAVKRRQHVPVHRHHKKKKKSAKIKRFFKKTLKLLAEENSYDHREYVHPRKRRYNNGHYNNERRYGHRKYNNRYNRHNRANAYCVPKHRVFRRLRKQGWSRLQLINQGRNRARIYASNSYDERYKLVIHKCSGRLIKSIPLYDY